MSKKTVHFILQEKGGSGKSFVSVVLAQYLQKNSDEILYCIDTDAQQSFARYSELNVEGVQLLDEYDEIDTSKFDTLIEHLVENEGITVVDTGASTFKPLLSYIKRYGVVELLEDAGVDCYVHVPIHGGAAVHETTLGLSFVLEHFNKNVVPWLNHHLALIEMNGEPFVKWNIYKENKHKIKGVIELRRQQQDTTLNDVVKMTTQSLTFEQALTSPNFHIMNKQRLRIYHRELFNELKNSGVFEKHESLTSEQE